MAKAGKPFKAAVLSVCVLAAACTAQYRNHGYVPSEEELANVLVGVDTRDSVAESIGTPTAGGVLNESGFYYVRSRVRTYGAFEPTEIERKLVAISFDSRGVVSNVEEFGLEDGRVVALSRRVTDSGLADITFLQQLIGNIGNFQASDFLE
jgi:outer membrane protein assembly factor BamE (lipoprotein component of BamABCDE complex)